MKRRLNIISGRFKYNPSDEEDASLVLTEVLAGAFFGAGFVGDFVLACSSSDEESSELEDSLAFATGFLQTLNIIVKLNYQIIGF